MDRIGLISAFLLLSNKFSIGVIQTQPDNDNGLTEPKKQKTYTGGKYL